jgi:type II secretory pathway pseudopilin PulG
MAALLVTLTVMSVVLSVALPVWRQQMRREKEAELIFRGEQYARALDLFQRKYPGALPPNIDVLVEQKFLRKKYKDPIANDDFQVLYQANAPAGGAPPPAASPASRPSTLPTPPAAVGAQPGRGALGLGPQGGVIGVVSKSKEQSIRLYKGRNRYNEWVFQVVAVTRQPGAVPGGGPPGRPGLPPPPGEPRRPGSPEPIGIERPPGPGGSQGPGRPPFPSPLGTQPRPPR